MGYRPDIIDVENPMLRFYGTKLYGYVDTSDLPSCNYLKFLGKIDNDEEWLGGCGPDITLTAKEFRTFMELYEKDFDQYGKYGKLSEYHDYDIIQKLKATESDKHIEWG